MKAFASEYPTHALAGVAWLRVADEAYTAGAYAEAQAGYAKAIDLLDDVCMELIFPGADIFRAEIHAMQRRMQDVVFKMGGF